MDCDFSPSSPHLLPNGLFSPQNRISFELLALSGLSGFSTFEGGKMLIFQWFANSRIVREFPPFSFKVRIATLTRNQFEGNLTWVRIPPAAPKIRPSAKGRWSYFWVPLPVVAPPQENRTCSGQVNCPCAKALLRKILVTAHPRRPTLWGPGSVGIHTDMP